MAGVALTMPPIDMRALAQQLGRRIATLRKQAGLSQQALAEAVGTAVQVIGRIERGAGAPSIERLQEIADALHVEPRELFEFERVEDERTEAAVERAAVLLRRLSAEDAELVVGMMEGLGRRLRRDRGSG